MTMMTRLAPADKPLEVDAVRYGDLAVAKPEKFDTVPWVVFHAPTGKDITRAIPDRLKSKAVKRREVKEWCVAFQNDSRLKPLWKKFHRGDIEPDFGEAALMIDVGKSL